MPVERHLTKIVKCKGISESISHAYGKSLALQQLIGTKSMVLQPSTWSKSSTWHGYGPSLPAPY